ncbi:MAG: carboxypeptidase regulatory-like domain-containing protein [Pyrinomonadaceae bacterium]
MLKLVSFVMLPLMAFFSNGTFGLVAEPGSSAPAKNTGYVEKMIVESGVVKINLDQNSLATGRSRGGKVVSGEFDLDIAKGSEFMILVSNSVMRTPIPSSMMLDARNTRALSAVLGRQFKQLMLDSMPYGSQYEMVIRDGETGRKIFNIDGLLMDYDADGKSFMITSGRLILSREYAADLGRPNETGREVGTITSNVKMRTFEIAQVMDGEMIGDVSAPGLENAGTRPGPDVVVGDIIGLSQFGSSGTKVGLAVGTTSCNYGTVDLNWFALPNNDHPVIPQNLYRMSGGPSGTDRMEQIGQSQVKHAFTALTQNVCTLGCNGVGGSRLGSGCSDPYSAGLNAGPNLGSKAWINPFTGEYPSTANSHGSHAHNGISHRLIVESSDLNPADNTGATYYAEGQYVTPHEYNWCQANPGQCNQYNNSSYRQYTVSGSGTSFTFSPAASTEREKPAIMAWSGATFVDIDPAPGVDGRGILAYKVTQTSPGVWHYEYALYNQNIDRGIGSFMVPIGATANLSNVGMHAPENHPGWIADGTTGDAGFSNAAWFNDQTAGAISWNTESFGVNPNANAIRWGTTYNFRFDSTAAPTSVNATIGFFKTGSPITVPVLAPGGSVAHAFVAGRVTDANGYGIRNAKVTITGSGDPKTVSTNMFGYYKVYGVEVGGTYTVSVSSKEYFFSSQQVEVLTDTSGVNFVALIE